MTPHFGDPLAEQRPWEDGLAYAPDTGWGALAVTGEDRLGWLNSLSSQKLDHLEPGNSVETLFLDPQGHLLWQAGVTVADAAAWLTVPRGVDQLARHLLSLRFRSQVQVETPDVEVWLVPQGPVLEAVRCLALAVWRDPWPNPGPGGVSYGPDVASHPGRDWSCHAVVLDTAAVDQAHQLAATAGGKKLGSWGFDAIRIAAWRAYSFDVDSKALPAELDLMRTGVHQNKGCYRGQEAVSKILTVGKPPRRLVFLHLDGSGASLPQPGAAVSLGGHPGGIGRVATAGVHHVAGPVALALVKRTVPVEQDLEVDTPDGPVAAAQTQIVPPSGESDSRPADLATSRRSLAGRRRRASGGISGRRV